MQQPGRRAGAITDHGPGSGGPLRVLHVLPADAARGSQVHARALRDVLNRPGREHRLLTIFDGPDQGMAPDEALGVRSTRRRRAGLDPVAGLRLRRAERRWQPHVVVAHGGESLKYAVVAGTRQSRLVYYAIGMVMPKGHRLSSRLLYRSLCRAADLVAGVSDDVVEECARLLRVPRARLLVAPNGRDPDRYRPVPAGNGASPPTVTFVGHLTPEKRPREAVAVVAALRARNVHVRAVMVGDGPLKAELEPLARDARMEMLGARDDVPGLLAASDVVLFPSGGEGEGMPGVLIEAGLAGVAIVAYDVAGVRTVIDDGRTGLVVGVGDVPAMTDAVAGLLAEPERRMRMGAAARRRCQDRFSLTASARIWDQAIDRLVACEP